jgi:hypothetical protein
MVKKTRKVPKHSQSRGMTIPQLRQAFEKIEAFVSKHKEDVDGFRKEWKKVFGKTVSEEAARDYLAFVREHGVKEQSGGSAPVGYDLRAGADIPYGSFPEYVQSGFMMPSDSFTLQKGDLLTPIIPAGMGSNAVMKGGKRSGRKTRKQKKQAGGAYLPSLATAAQEFMTRPFTMNSPPTTLQQYQMESKGVNGFPSGRPEDNPLPPLPNQTIYSASVSPASRAF